MIFQEDQRGRGRIVSKQGLRSSRTEASPDYHSFAHLTAAGLPPLAPSQVVVIRQERAGQTSVSLLWQEPEQPNGIILEYEIKYYEKVLPLREGGSRRGTRQGSPQLTAPSVDRTRRCRATPPSRLSPPGPPSQASSRAPAMCSRSEPAPRQAAAVSARPWRWRPGNPVSAGSGEGKGAGPGQVPDLCAQRKGTSTCWAGACAGSAFLQLNKTEAQRRKVTCPRQLSI